MLPKCHANSAIFVAASCCGSQSILGQTPELPKQRQQNVVADLTGHPVCILTELKEVCTCNGVDQICDMCPCARVVYHVRCHSTRRSVVGAGTVAWSNT